MTKQQKVDKKALSSTTATPSSAEYLQTRPFAATNNSPQTSPNLQKQSQKSSKIGHSFGKILVQPKLKIGEPGDKYEQEADKVAAQVVQKINSPTTQRQELGEEEDLQMKSETGTIQREDLPDEDELMMKSETGTIQREELPEEEELQMKSETIQRQSKVDTSTASDELETSLNNARSGGQSLQPELRMKMESAMGADFSAVKVHTDDKADRLNKSIQAKAFTTGKDVFFRQGEYNPGSQGGQELIAHELTHVVQQGGNSVQKSSQKESFVQQKQGLLNRETQKIDDLQTKLNSNIIQRDNGDKEDKTPARLHIHADIDTADFGLDALMNGNVGHAWISLEWKNPNLIPGTIPENHKNYLSKGGKFADPMGFWPRMFDTFNQDLQQWSNLPRPGQEPEGYTGPTRASYSTNILKSYVPGQMVHPDTLHQSKVKASQTYDLTEKEAINVINYAESKRQAQYSVYFYNCTTFAKQAVKAAGKNPPSMSKGGICYPNALYDGIKKNQENKIGHTTVGTNTVSGSEATSKKR